MMLPIVIMILQVYQCSPGESNLGKKIMLQELQFNNISTSAILTATAPQIMPPENPVPEFSFKVL